MSDSKFFHQAVAEIDQYLSLIRCNVVDASEYSSWQQHALTEHSNLGVMMLGLCMSTCQHLQGIHHQMNELPAEILEEILAWVLGSANVLGHVLMAFHLWLGDHFQMEQMLSWVFCQPSFLEIKYLEIMDMMEAFVLLPSLDLLLKLRMLEVIQGQIPMITLGATTSVCHIYFEVLVPPIVIGMEAFHHPWRFLNGGSWFKSLKWAEIEMLDGVFLLDVEIHSMTSCTAVLMVLSHSGLCVQELNILLGGRAVYNSEVLYWLVSGNLEKVQFYVEDSVTGCRVDWGLPFEEGTYPLMVELREIPDNIKSVDEDVLVRDLSPVECLGSKIVRSSFGGIDISETMREHEDRLQHFSDCSEMYSRLPWVRDNE
ncbi:hypothetical protein BS47DRAFT_1368516 [Hydnum rufescens UP504]|uniref:Uncharacterized protein n=1 Tax=Hydnum rufescens UP504 TaxID=1448309 RepID=A0A9P6AFL8_9AGAM|nr:hypothetical protein BS47DRAFT_1368516 [Hydnum rufescens UP504]